MMKSLTSKIPKWGPSAFYSNMIILFNVEMVTTPNIVEFLLNEPLAWRKQKSMYEILVSLFHSKCISDHFISLNPLTSMLIHAHTLKFKFSLRPLWNKYHPLILFHIKVNKKFMIFELHV